MDLDVKGLGVGILASYLHKYFTTEYGVGTFLLRCRLVPTYGA